MTINSLLFSKLGRMSAEIVSLLVSVFVSSSASVLLKLDNKL